MERSRTEFAAAEKSLMPYLDERVEIAGVGASGRSASNSEEDDEPIYFVHHKPFFCPACNNEWPSMKEESCPRCHFVRDDRVDTVAKDTVQTANLAEEAKAADDQPAQKKMQEPIKFLDALGRKFSFPFYLCSTWSVSFHSSVRNSFTGDLKSIHRVWNTSSKKLSPMSTILGLM